MFLRKTLSSSAALGRRGLASQTVSELLPSSQSPFTPRLNFFNSVTPDGSQIPTYRVLDGVGVPIQGAEVPQVRLFTS